MSKTVGYKIPPKVQLPTPFSKLERECFQRYLSQSSNYWEYGCGGTTQMAYAMPHILNITSIDCDKEYSEEVSAVCPKSTMIYVDVGATNEKGWPIEDALQPTWFRYSQIWSAAEKSYDFALLAGRFRLACALWIVLNPRQVKHIAIANFVNRPEYHDLADFVDVVEVVENLAIVKPKQRFNRKACEALYEKVKLDPR